MTAVKDIIGAFDIGPMQPSERNFVFDSWMRSSKWRRVAIHRAVEDGEVIVARDGDFIYGWLCTVRGRIAFGVTRPHYGEIGIMRSLWEHAGKPDEIIPPGTKSGYVVLERLRKADKATR